MRRFKVIIVGGGPAGALTALSLVHLRPEMAGDILVLEAKEFPREKICGGGVSGRVTRALETLGIDMGELPRIPVSGFSVFCGDDYYTAPFSTGGNYVIRRSVFDRYLLDKVMERGVAVETANRAVGAFYEENRVAVVDRRHNVYHAEVLVGADGVNGRSRQWFGMPHPAPKALLLQTDFPRDPGCEALRDRLIVDYSPCFFDHSGYVWFFPSLDEEGRPVVNAGITGGEYGNRGYVKLRRMFHEIMAHHPEIGSMAPSEIKFKQYPERDYSIRQARCGDRVIFVGEQLGVDSHTGEGLSVCADSAMAAAQEITEALDGGDLSFKRYSRRLMRGDFFPLLLVGKTMWTTRIGPRRPIALSISSIKPSQSRESLLELFAKVYSGCLPPTFVYSPRAAGAIIDRSARYLAGLVRDGWRGFGSEQEP